MASAGKLGAEQISPLLHHRCRPGSAYRALETPHSDGRARVIGVSNVMPEHLAWLGKSVTVVPAVNQIDVPP